MQILIYVYFCIHDILTKRVCKALIALEIKYGRLNKRHPAYLIGLTKLRQPRLNIMNSSLLIPARRLASRSAPQPSNRRLTTALLLESVENGFMAILSRDVRADSYILPRLHLPKDGECVHHVPAIIDEYARNLHVQVENIAPLGANQRVTGVYELIFGVYQTPNPERILGSYTQFDNRAHVAEAIPLDEVPATIHGKYVMPAGQILHWFLQQPGSQRETPRIEMIRRTLGALRTRAEAEQLEWFEPVI